MYATFLSRLKNNNGQQSGFSTSNASVTNWRRAMIYHKIVFFLAEFNSEN